MAMAMAISRRLLAAGRLPRSPTLMLAAGRLPASPTPSILQRKWYKVPTVAEAIGEVFEDVSSFLKSPRSDVGKALQLAEEIARVLKNEPPELAIAKARGLEAELSKVLHVSSFETRLSQAEVNIKTYRKISFGVGTLFAASLMSIPATVYIENTKLETRVEKLESALDQTTPKTFNVDAKVSHGFIKESETYSPQSSSPQ